MNTFFKTAGKRVASVALGLMLLVSTGLATPQKAHAILGVGDISFDPSNFAQMIVDWGIQYIMSTFSDGLLQKEVIWDTIANTVAKAALQSMAQSMANWTASGFDGSPTFVTNYRQHMLNLSDGATDGYINQLLSDGRIQSPFSTGIIQSIRNDYYSTTGSNAFGSRNQYTLRETCANDQAFLSGNFAECGLSGWIAAWREPANNPFGFGLLATEGVDRNVRDAQSIREQELGWGGGFLPAQNCGDEAATEGDTTEGETADTTEGEGEVSLSQTESTQNCATRTPSSVVAHSANKFFVDLGIDIGVAADEIDELIASFFVNLVTDSLQGDGGLSSGSAGTGRPALGGGTPTDTEGSRSCEDIPLTGGVVPSSSAINSFKLSIDNLTISTEQFKERWEAIKGEAERAKSKLLSCGATENFQGTSPSGAQRLYDTEVKPALERANSSLSRSEEALTKLADLRTRADAAKNGQANFERIACELQDLQGSGITPTPGEIVYAAQNSTELPDELDPNLFTKFKNISERSCAQINLSGGN